MFIGINMVALSSNLWMLAACLEPDYFNQYQKMEHLFELPVEYNGQELNLDGRLFVSGYVYKIYIMINDGEFVFEKDDDGKYRVLTEVSVSGTKVDKGMVEAVIDVLDGLSEA